MTRARPALLRLVGWRILSFGLAAMAIQFALVLTEYWSDDQGLARRIIELQTDDLAKGLRHEDGRISYVPPAGLLERYRFSDRDHHPVRWPDDVAGTDPDGIEEESEGEIPEGYYARIRTRGGAVLFTNCGEECTEHFLPLDVNPPAFWQRSIRAGKPLTFAGGRTVEVGDETALIELAVVRDPDRLIRNVLFHEMLDHMLVPMTLMLTIVIGATLFSLARALRPVSVAAEEAERIDPRDPTSRIDTAALPLEVARLAAAVNRSLDRVGELIRSQRLFASAIAHEIRTPVAIVRMELERIDHPRARKALGDLEDLTHILEQLTALARLETVEASSFSPISLAAVAEDVVSSIAPYVFERGKSIAFADLGAGEALGLRGLMEDMIRNLVENAVRHTPDGTTIIVEAGPGAVLVVADDGPGYAPAQSGEVEAGAVKSAGGLGIGLRIVRRIADIHGATVHLWSRPGEGTRVEIRFAER